MSADPTTSSPARSQDNLLYGLKHRPHAPAPEIPRAEALSRPARVAEAAALRQLALRSRGRLGRLRRRPGIARADGAPAGARSARSSSSRLDGDVFGLGLRGTMPPAPRAELADRLLEARPAMQDRLLADDRASGAAGRALRPRPLQHQRDASPRTCCSARRSASAFDIERLADQPYVRDTLDATGLRRRAGRGRLRGSPRRCSSCSPTCRPTTSISASSASSRPTSCRTIGR